MIDSMIFENIKVIFFPDLPINAYYSIGSDKTPTECKIAYDLYQVLVHDISWFNEPKGGWTVNFQSPLFHTDEPPCSVVID
ncbi:hypothetical protein D3C80_1872970 [compost metagenome]